MLERKKKNLKEWFVFNSSYLFIINSLLITKNLVV